MHSSGIMNARKAYKNMKKDVRLKTNRLLIRPTEKSDLSAVYEYARDESITMMLYFPKTYDETYDYVFHAADEWLSEAPRYYEFVIELDGRVIGGTDLEVQGGGAYEIGWELNGEFRGMGYATEAAAAVLGFAFGTLGAEKVIAHCDSRNTASENVMKKLGMKLTDSTQTRRYRTGSVSGELEYAVFAEEYYKQRSAAAE